MRIIAGFWPKLNPLRAAATSILPVSNQSEATPIDPSWQPVLQREFEQDYMIELKTYIASRKKKRAVVFPHSSLWFNAFTLTPFDDVKVVILGQDPYHGPGQAHGLSFSVPEGVAIPPSLLNIYKEIDADLGGAEGADPTKSLVARRAGCLTQWAKQGVFLLNSVLTVEQGQAAAHQGRGWETFTDSIISQLSEQREGLVFLLWGSYAQKKGQVIDANKHLVLKCPHPSPLSAHRGFLGCRHFSQTNDYLLKTGHKAIDWFDVS